jgi:hypothetical protein
LQAQNRRESWLYIKRANTHLRGIGAQLLARRETRLLAVFFWLNLDGFEMARDVAMDARDPPRRVRT